MKSLPGKTAFITGGSSGIGLGIAKALLGAGMNVAITGTSDAHLSAAVAELGPTVLPLAFDVRDRDAFAAAADAAEARFGKIHLLCNNAGIGVLGPIESAAFADIDRIVGVNLVGTLNGIATILPRILAHGEGGHIVNTSSMSGLLPHARGAMYAATKAAGIAMIEAMRPELEPRGVICSVFCPGAVRTRIGGDRPSPFAHLFMSPEEAGERFLRGILADELFILTHGEFRDGLAARAEAIAAAVPDRPENAEYKAAFPHLFANPAHRR
jgi:NAD(P)-dependent dehydrogenase (short-subunit alcohol dehydrogenase family)